MKDEEYGYTRRNRGTTYRLPSLGVQFSPVRFFRTFSVNVRRESATGSGLASYSIFGSLLVLTVYITVRILTRVPERMPRRLEMDKHHCIISALQRKRTAFLTQMAIAVSYYSQQLLDIRSQFAYHEG